MATNINRRAALGSLAAISALLVDQHASAAITAQDTLSALIAAHEKAREAFCIAIDELENAEPDREARVEGMLGVSYSLRNGEDRIAEWIDEHFERHAENLQAIAKLSPGAAAEGLSATPRLFGSAKPSPLSTPRNCDGRTSLTPKKPPLKQYARIAAARQRNWRRSFVTC
jgi:hypothetical protein